MKRMYVSMVVLAMVTLLSAAACFDNTLHPDRTDDYELEISYSGESWVTGEVYYKDGTTHTWIRGKNGSYAYSIDDVKRIDLTVEKAQYGDELPATATLYDYAGDRVREKDFTSQAVEFTLKLGSR